MKRIRRGLDLFLIPTGSANALATVVGNLAPAGQYRAASGNRATWYRSGLSSEAE